MRSLLERQIAAIDDRLILVAPSDRPIPADFRNVLYDADRHRSYLHEVQRFRGDIYFKDGAIRSLSADGRHETPEDDRSWHVLRLDDQDRVSACIWYREHEGPMSIDRLRVSECPLIAHEEWGSHLHGAMTSEFGRAHAEQVPYAEIGGWAVSPGRRCSVEGILLALSAFSLGRMFGGAIGMAAATVRHASATILRRLGGSLLECEGIEVPPYFDPRYDCEMELLRFDSRRTDPRYESLVEALADRLTRVAVFTPLALGACSNPASVAA